MAAVAVRVVCVVGARPNFMKIAPVLKALSSKSLFEVKLVHTGQHYDHALSEVFFADLAIPRPDQELEVGSTSHAVQTAETMKRFEKTLERQQPRLVIVVGDVNSTLACALTAVKFDLQVPFAWDGKLRQRPVVAHVEAGLRSFDPDMPEEINRRLTDTIADLLFVSEQAGLDNLRIEGVPEKRIHFVGNVMIDTLIAAKERAMRSTILEQLGLQDRRYLLLTLHRPANVDRADTLFELLAVLDEIAIATTMPIVFPVHPRTRTRLDTASVVLDQHRFVRIDPLGYVDFLRAMASAHTVFTDSGGIQEETTVLGIPCLTLRDTTERPVTVQEGTNTLAGTRREPILDAFWRSFRKSPGSSRIPHLWDGRAAERIAAILADTFASDRV
ncbi:MAG: UDP-N-acetylglucosamine 2-epimerase (non-hydrolyzing) [Pseudomonadota bacterium]